MLKAAVVGLGSMGRNHARVYHELDDVHLIGVADQNESLAEKIGRMYSAQVFTDYRKLIEEAKPDVVSLALPTGHHFECAMAFIDAGVNVLLEKLFVAVILNQSPQVKIVK